MSEEESKALSVQEEHAVLGRVLDGYLSDVEALSM